MEPPLETLQNQIVDCLCEYIAVWQDELRWEVSFSNTHDQLIAAASRAK